MWSLGQLEGNQALRSLPIKALASARVWEDHRFPRFKVGFSAFIKRLVTHLLNSAR